MIYVIRREILPSIYEKRWVPSSTPITSVFGKRLRFARELRELPQDKLGVMIGLDESCASARMSRYERGVHEPPLATAKLIASALGVPLAYMYCEDDELAQLLWRWQQLPSIQKKRLSKEWSTQVAELLSTDTRS